MGHRSWKIALDFGSTYSSVAYCLIGGSAQGCAQGRIYTVTGSINRNARSNDEFPTIILYDGEQRQPRWGTNAQSALRRKNTKESDEPECERHVIEAFKAGLNDGIAGQHVRDRLRALPFPKSIDDVVTEYLTFLLQHTKGRLEQVGYEDGDNVHLICTVPAMWSTRARVLTQQAATKAKRNCGFTYGEPVSLRYEPAAAAAYVFYQDQSVSLKKDDAFIIVDAGGETVDSITYQEKSVDPLRLDEVSKGTGQHCGSNYLNCSLQSYVEELLADECYLRGPGVQPFDQVMRDNVLNDFEYVTKRDYPNSPYEDSCYTTFTIPGLRNNPIKGFHRGDIFVTKAQLEAIFLLILERCWKVIEAQLRQAYEKNVYPRLLVHVGGFAGSSRYQSYIKERCNRFIEQHMPQSPMKQITPPTPASATAIGAISCELHTEMIGDHYSRSCVCITHNLQKDRPPLQFKRAVYEDDLEGKKYIRDCVDILLATNDLIPPTGKLVPRDLYLTVKADQDSVAIEIPIYVIEDKDGIQDCPIEDERNKGHILLHKVKFEVDIAPFRGRLKKMKVGTDKPFEEPMHGTRSSGRTRNRNGPNPTKASNQSPIIADISNDLQRPRTSPSGLSSGIDEHRDEPSFYYWIDYIFEVKSVGTLMEYHLRIKNVDEQSKRDLVNLAGVIEPC